MSAGGSGSISVRLYEAGNRNAAIGQKDFSIGPYQQLRLDTVFSELGLTASDRLKDRTNVQVVVVATSGSARVTASAMIRALIRHTTSPPTVHQRA